MQKGQSGMGTGAAAVMGAGRAGLPGTEGEGAFFQAGSLAARVTLAGDSGQTYRSLSQPQPKVHLYTTREATV